MRWSAVSSVNRMLQECCVSNVIWTFAEDITKLKPCMSYVIDLEWVKYIRQRLDHRNKVASVAWHQWNFWCLDLFSSRRHVCGGLQQGNGRASTYCDVILTQIHQLEWVRS